VSLAHDVGANDGDIAFWGGDLLDPICDAWEDGRDAVWGSALDAHALRMLGRIAEAIEVERALESLVDALRKAVDR
jgi:hypothetical protein